MSSQNISPPPPFLSEPGMSQSLEWEDWLDIFDNYLMALDGQEFSPACKKALLLNTIGREAQQVFKYLPIALRADGQPMADVYTEARQRLTVRFAKEVNLVFNVINSALNRSYSMNQ